jgi:hypothetical protein
MLTILLATSNIQPSRHYTSRYQVLERMSTLQTIATTLLAVTSFLASGQGTIIYDQQSSTDETPYPSTGRVIQQYLPFGQSFTPTLSSVDFLELKLYDNNSVNGVGATLYVNLRSSSITGPVLGTTALVTLTNGFGDVAYFYFPVSVPVASGATYYFEPVVQSGDQWKIDLGEYNYPGGTTISQGQSLPGSDVWFREGIIVPEPSAGIIALLGVSTFIYARKRRGTCVRQS